MKNAYFALSLLTISGSVLSQDTKTVEPDYTRSSGALQIIIGVGHVYGARVGAGFYVADNWSIELAHGTIVDVNVGGGEYAMTLSGAAINTYFPLKGHNAIVLSILYSYAHVTDPSYEYTGDFTILSPMIGLDHSAAKGFGFFLHGGLALGSEHYRKGSGTLAADVGISWRFSFLSAH